MKFYSPINKSYVLSFILNNFNIEVIDTHLQVQKDFGKKRFNPGLEKPTLVIVDDENYFTNNAGIILRPLTRESLEQLNNSNTHFLFKSKELENEYRFKNSFSFEFFDILEDCFAMNYVDSNILRNKFDHKYNFICLNGRYKKNRAILVKKIIQMGLAESNYVSFYDNKELLDVNTPKLDWYYNQSPDRVKDSINNIPCTGNFKNYIRINEELSSKIILMAETQQSVFYPCEKTFCGFFTRRIPITISSLGANKRMADEGFDMFEDLVNYDYDEIKDEPLRIIACMHDNYEILSKGIHFDESIIKRVDNNFNYLKNDWFKSKLRELEILLHNVENS